MHEFHSNVNKVNKAVAKVRTIGDRLPLSYHENLRKFTPVHMKPDMEFPFHFLHFYAT